MHSPLCLRFLVPLTLALLLAAPGRALVFYDTADPSHNTSAPAGAFAGAGWQYEGVFGDNLGTAIGAQYFLTAAHVSVETTFTRLGIFTGGVDTTYSVDATAFGGAGYYTVPGTDLRIYQITGTFDTWAELYTGSSETGALAVLNGNGAQRGADVYLNGLSGPELKGWLGSSTNHAPRWGTNLITGIVPDASSPVGDLLVADFDALSGTEEAMFTGNDSGAGLFINDGGVWRLAGVNYAVDGSFNTSPTNTGAFNGALFDKGGYWQGQDPSWQFNPDLPVDTPQSLYASRVSTYAGQIQAITGVPEPGSAMIVCISMLGFTTRRRLGYFAAFRKCSKNA